jgi:hypothetical protein
MQSSLQSNRDQIRAEVWEKEKIVQKGTQWDWDIVSQGQFWILETQEEGKGSLERKLENLLTSFGISGPVRDSFTAEFSR